MRVLVPILLLVTVGCAPRGAGLDAQQAGCTHALEPPTRVDALDALVVPPRDWKPDPLKSTARHNQQVWISPRGGTAYGVIHFTLPLPVGEDLALLGFLGEMRKSEGEATLLSKARDGDRIRFVAEGGKYRIRGILLTRGFHGWAVYAGTLRSRSIALDELALAVQARENTALGSPAGPSTGR